jgi:hypothetical protein
MLKINYNGNQYDVSQDFINAIFEAKVKRTATIIKNVRERADGSLKDLATLALQNGLMDAGQAFSILAEKDKDVNAENKKMLIDLLKEKGLLASEKTEEPTDEDMNQALEKVLKGGGQNDF